MPRARAFFRASTAAALLAASPVAAPLAAQTFTLTDPNSHTKAVSPDGAAIVKLQPLTAVGAGSFSTALANASYPNPPWQFNTNGLFGGVIDVSSYDAGWKNGSALGGGTITANYDYGLGPLQPGHKLQWIQVINTNVPLGGATSPYIDPQPNDDNLPFYWTDAELPGYTSGGGLKLGFYDFSKRSPATLATTDPITWNANLYLVDWDGATTVNVHNGVSWGWEMRSATAGTSTAVFANPSPTCPPATCAGLGTSSFAWGNGAAFGSPPSSLRFTPVHFNPKPGEVFKLGQIDYFNGTIATGSGVDQVDLDFNIAFDNNPDANHVLHSRLSLVNTPNTNDPIASADFVNFVAGGFNASFHVLEGQSASADLFARILATSTVVGDKSLDTPDPFSRVDYSIQLVDLRPSSPGGFTTPEPGVAVLLAPGLAAVLWYRRRARVSAA